MNIPMPIQNAALRLLDLCAALLPQQQPSAEQLSNCKIVSHRGEHDNQRVFENTFAAFDAAYAAGVWGLECDIRWTKDLHPVVIHDPDCKRLFGSPLVIAETLLKDLQSELPDIPTLESMVARYGKKMHLMIEIKAEHYPDPPRQEEILKAILAGLEPCADFHFLALDTTLFARVKSFTRRCCLPVAELNVTALGEQALSDRLAGLSGHFYFINRARQAKHEAAGQNIGTGFVASRNSLFREINRGVAWVFSNDAVKLQGIIDSLKP